MMQEKVIIEGKVFTLNVAATEALKEKRASRGCQEYREQVLKAIASLPGANITKIWRNLPPGFCDHARVSRVIKSLIAEGVIVNKGSDCFRLYVVPVVKGAHSQPSSTDEPSKKNGVLELCSAYPKLAQILHGICIDGRPVTDEEAIFIWQDGMRARLLARQAVEAFKIK